MIPASTPRMNLLKLTVSGALAITGWLCSTSSVEADVSSLGYSFVRNGGGGIATVRIDVATGKFVDDQVLFESKACQRPEKLRYDTEREQYLLTNETDKKSGPHLFLVPTDKDVDPQEVKLPAMPDEIRLGSSFALVTCDEDRLVRVELESGQISGTWNCTGLLDPKANGPQDIRFLADGETVILSFQKDSRKGKKKGSRIAAFRLPDMTVIADSQLPRSHPDLHIRGNKKEQGPGPEIVYVDEAGDRILTTLDLYGAVAVADLSTFLAGEEVTWKYLSTAVDESWGNAFPDRLTAFECDGKQVALVANSGVDGGIALVDLTKREIVWRGDTPPGLETPIFVASESKVFSVCSGKQKARGRRDTEKTYLPQHGVFVFDFAVADAHQRPSFERTPTEKYMFRVSRAGTVDNPWIVLAGGLGSPDTLMTLNPRTGKIVDERPAVGALMRFEQE